MLWRQMVRSSKVGNLADEGRRCTGAGHEGAAGFGSSATPPRTQPLPHLPELADVAVFRRLYEEVGLGWVYAVTRYPAVERAANAVYDVWAKYRLPLTGRPDLSVVLQQKTSCRADNGGGGACDVQQ